MLTKTAEREEVEQAAMRAIDRIARREGPYAAQLIGAATWHAITVAPNCDRIVAAHLMGRRFGVYLPETLGHRAGSRESLLPGYVFLFVWGIDDHAERILGCPGVIDFLRMGLSREIVLIPDEIIDEVREIENRLMPTILPAAAIAMAGGASKKKKKRWRKGRKAKEIIDHSDEVVAVYPYSPMIAAMEGLDSAGRISAFLSAIGLGAPK